MNDRSGEEMIAALSLEPVSITFTGDEWALISATIGWGASAQGDPTISERLRGMERQIDQQVVLQVGKSMGLVEP